MTKYLLVDRWKTHFGAVQESPIVAERVIEQSRERIYPRFILEWQAIVDNCGGVTSENSAAAVKAADIARSKCRATWKTLPEAAVPVRCVNDEYGNRRWIDIGEQLLFMSPLNQQCTDSSSPPSPLFDRVEQLSIERMEPHHLPGCLLIEYELFGDENSLLVDFATEIAAGYCAVDQSRKQIVGHVTFEMESPDTMLYTSFATSDTWRGKGVAKAVVDGLMKYIFCQKEIVNGKMYVRGGHQQVVGLYKFYGFSLIEEEEEDDNDNEEETEDVYGDGEKMICMGGPLQFAVFAKRLGWSYESRDALVRAEQSHVCSAAPPRC